MKKKNSIPIDSKQLSVTQNKKKSNNKQPVYSKEKKEETYDELVESLLNPDYYILSHKNEIKFPLKIKKNCLTIVREKTFNFLHELTKLYNKNSNEFSKDYYYKEGDFLLKININKENCFYYLKCHDAIELCHEKDLSIELPWGNIWNYQACYKDNEVFLNYLASNKIKIIQKNSKNSCVLDLLLNNYFDILDEIDKYDKIDYNILLKNQTGGRTIISWIIQENNMLAFDFLISKYEKGELSLSIKNEFNTTPIFWCAIHNRSDMAIKILEKEIDQHYALDKWKKNHIQRAKSNKHYNYVRKIENYKNEREKKTKMILKYWIKK